MASHFQAVVGVFIMASSSLAPLSHSMGEKEFIRVIIKKDFAVFLIIFCVCDFLSVDGRVPERFTVL